MDIARTSMIHAHAPHFLWPNTVCHCSSRPTSGGAGVGGTFPGGAIPGGAGAPSSGPGETGTGRVATGGAHSGGGATDAVGAREAGVGAAAAGASAAGGVAAAGVAVAAAAATAPDPCHWPPSPCPPPPSPSAIPSPPESSLTASSSTPVTDYYRTYRPVLSYVLSSLVMDPHASLSSVSALTAAVPDFAATRRLDYATRVVAAPPTRPLSDGGESALGCDALEERQFELEFLASASPHLCAMLLAPEGDPDALDIPTPRTYVEAVSGPWAS
ncbi:unnamed protein product [Closterium sp. NIES-54]